MRAWPEASLPLGAAPSPWKLVLVTGSHGVCYWHLVPGSRDSECHSCVCQLCPPAPPHHGAMRPFEKSPQIPQMAFQQRAHSLLETKWGSRSPRPLRCSVTVKGVRLRLQ